MRLARAKLRLAGPLVVVMIGLLAIFVAAADGPGGKKPKTGSKPESELAKAPAKSRELKNPFAGQPDALLAGKKLFKKHCVECHGDEGQGQGKAPNLRNDEVQNVPPGVLYWFLKNGNLKAGMPSWSGIPDQQRWQLVTYLQSFKTDK